MGIAVRPCPACRSGDAAYAGIADGFEMARCGSCRTLFTASADPGVSEHYDEYYDASNLEIPAWVATRSDEIVATFEPSRRLNRLLDVGCGAGAMLAAAVRAGWDAEGIDVAASAVEHLRGQGLTARCGLLEEAGYEAQSFDVIVAVEVLEHVPDPDTILAESFRLLRPGGLLFATTPNVRSACGRALGVDWIVACPPDHLHLFSPSGLASLLGRNGFERVTTWTEGINPYELRRALRRRPAPERAPGDRVPSAAHLNELLTARPSRRLLKRSANAALRSTGLGDNLKVTAHRP